MNVNPKIVKSREFLIAQTGKQNAVYCRQADGISKVFLHIRDLSHLHETELADNSTAEVVFESHLHSLI